jgi:hypothetical protein
MVEQCDLRFPTLVSRVVRTAPAVLYCFTSFIGGVVRQVLETSLGLYRVSVRRFVSY